MSTIATSIVNNFSVLGAVALIACFIGSSPLSGPHKSASEVNLWKFIDKPQHKLNGTSVPIRKRMESVPLKLTPVRPLTNFDLEGRV